MSRVVYWLLIFSCAIVVIVVLCGIWSMIADAVSVYRQRRQDDRLDYAAVADSEALHRSMAARRGWQKRRARAAERERQRQQAEAQAVAERRPVTAETRRKRAIVIHDDDNGGQS